MLMGRSAFGRFCALRGCPTQMTSGKMLVSKMPFGQTGVATNPVPKSPMLTNSDLAQSSAFSGGSRRFWCKMSVVVAFGSLLIPATSSQAQHELIETLQDRNLEKLRDYKAEKPEQIWAKETTEEIVKAARTGEILIEKDAATRIVDWLTAAEVVEAFESGPRPSEEEQAADRTRFVLRLLSYSRAPKSATAVLALDGEGVDDFRKQIKIISGFCPCWPFCRG